MFFDVGTAAAVSSSINIFGLPLSDFINSIIALFAVLGFITSVWISIKSLKHAKNLHLYNERFKVITYLLDFSFIEKPSPEELIEVLQNLKKALFLFKNHKELNLVCNQLVDFYNENKPLPDYIKRYKKALIKEDTAITIENAFLNHYRLCVMKQGKDVIW